jgi:hypothetical protein
MEKKDMQKELELYRENTKDMLKKHFKENPMARVAYLFKYGKSPETFVDEKYNDLKKSFDILSIKDTIKKEKELGSRRKLQRYYSTDLERYIDVPKETTVKILSSKKSGGGNSKKPNAKTRSVKKPNTKTRSVKKPNTKTRSVKKPNAKTRSVKKPNAKI